MDFLIEHYPDLQNLSNYFYRIEQIADYLELKLMIWSRIRKISWTD